MKRLSDLLTQLNKHIAHADCSNTSISTATVGWHIEHTLLVINQIIATLQTSEPSKYESKFSFWKLVIFTTKKIPRGKAKAPKQVQPANSFTITSLQNHLLQAQAAIQQLSSLQANHYFKHPIFGNLNVKSTIKFLGIHTSHHLNIINDIVKNSK
jgi:hypothetical protein